MGIGYWTRILFMCLSLVGVMWIMHSLQTKGLGLGFSSVVGFARAAKVLEHPRVDLCGNRVHSLRIPGGKQPLQPMALETWLRRNCSIVAEDLRQVALNDMKAAEPVLTMDFIEGGTDTIKQTPTGRFVWKQISFHSLQLEQAIKQLANLHQD